MSYSSGLRSGNRLVDLDNHILESILSKLGVVEVVRLRQLCRRLYHITQSRQLWVDLAQDCVLKPGLPWPEHALPVKDQSCETIETLTIKAILLNSVWDKEIQPPPSICHPTKWFPLPTGERVTWMEFMLSRWLLVGLRSGGLALWDMDAPDRSHALVDSISLEGWPISGVIRDGGDTGVGELIISTSTHNTYIFELRLLKPRERSQQDPDAIKLLRTEKFTGYHAIKDTYQNFIAFSRSVDTDLPCILDRRKSRAVDLVGDDAVPKSVIGIQIRRGIIAVAKDLNVELYQISDVVDALSATSADDHRITSFQSLRYPLNRMIWQGCFLNPSKPDAPEDPIRPPSFVLGAMESHLFCRWALVPGVVGTRGMGSPDWHLAYQWSQDSGARTVVAATCANSICWGQSGRRIVFTATTKLNRSPSLYAVFVPDTFTSTQRVARQNTRRYDLPDTGVKDVAWVSAFDETTGLVAATAAGKVFVVDILSSLLRPDSANPKSESTSSAEDHAYVTYDPEPDMAPSLCHTLFDNIPMKEYASDFTDVALPMKASRTDHCPPPPPWPAWAPANPDGFGGSDGQTEIRFVQSRAPPVPPEVIPPKFSNDWSRYSGVKQWHNHYGSVQWFFNEVLHLPGRVTPIFFGDLGDSDDSDDASDSDDEVRRDPDEDHPCFALYHGDGKIEPVEACADGSDRTIGVIARSIVVEVNGKYYFHRHSDYETLHIRGATTVMDVLLWARGTGHFSTDGPLDVDRNALNCRALWTSCARATRSAERQNSNSRKQLFGFEKASSLASSALDRPSGVLMGKRKHGVEPSSASTSERRKHGSVTTFRPSSQLNSLPVEILKAILLQYLSSVPSYEYYDSLGLLRLVCHRWSTVIAEAPTLWSFIDPDLGISHINVVAKRSGTTPLTICDSGEDSQSPDSIRHLCRYLRRWRSVRLHVHRGFFKFIWGDSGSVKSPMETLKHLELMEYDDNPTGDHSNDVHPMHGLNAPFLPHLSVLRLTSPIPSPVWLLLLLAHCPSLFHCTLRPYNYHEVSEADSTTPDIVELLHMETMEIYCPDPSFVGTLLRGLRTPRCTSKMVEFQLDNHDVPVFRHRFHASLCNLVEVVSILEFKQSWVGTVEIRMQTDDGMVLLVWVQRDLTSITPLAAWLGDLTNEMPHLRSAMIDCELFGRGTEGAFAPGQPLWSLSKVMELRIREFSLAGDFSDWTTKEILLSALGNPGASGDWLMPDLTKLSIESRPQGYRMVDLRDVLKSRYSRRDDGKDPPKPLEELRVTIWENETKIFEEIEAIVGRDRFVKVDGRSKYRM